jgi:hypothetical protein
MTVSKNIPGKVYKFVHKEDVSIRTNLQDRGFKDSWLEIDNYGTITVKGSNQGGYAWDGCSPKWNFIDLIFGTPDGRFDCNTDKQITYYASMIHDALYQYKSSISLSRKEADILFKLNLKKSTFKLWQIYYCAVRLFGGFYGQWKTNQVKGDIEITHFSWINSGK